MEITLEEIEALPMWQLHRVFARALRGHKYLDPEQAFEDDDFVKDFMEIGAEFVLQNTLEGLAQKGLIEVKGFRETLNGEESHQVWGRTKLGEEVANHIMGEQNDD